MKNISFKKLTLSILALVIIGVGLTGCLVPDITVTGTAKLIVSGDYYYDIKMDGITQWDYKPSGTYTLTNIPIGNHKFEVIDVDGASFGYDSKTVYITAGTITTIYLNPQQATKTGTAKIVLSGSYYYDIKMDGYTYFFDRLPGTYTLTDILVGNHKFEAIDVDGASFGYDSKTVYITAGTNYIYLYP